MESIVNLMTVQDVANKLKVTPQYIRKLIKEEKLRADMIGSQWLIQREAVEEYIHANNYYIEPDDHERLSNDIPDVIALSFFSGAMGLDLGMEKGGIRALLACEFNKYCRMTITRNNPNIALIGDINNYSADSILQLAKVPKGRKVDVIFGGPPCQAFSTAGSRRAFNDDRGNVFLRYIKLIEEIRPSYVVIENVRGLLSTPYPYGEIKNPIKGGALCVILDQLKAAGYTVSFELYNAANFGAPQIRERVVIIGKLGKEKVPYLSPTHDEEGRFGLHHWVSFSETVVDIECKKQHYIEFPENRLKYFRMLTDGQYWKNLPKELQKEAMGKSFELGGGKTGFYRRICSNRPSPTLVTNPTMPATDLCHPFEDRPLSVEEYCRIQGFPDDWEICGPILEQYKQIGNAVPLKLGEAIAKTIIADMNGEKLPQIKGYNYSRYKNTNDVTWQAIMNLELRKAKEKMSPTYNCSEQLTLV